MTNATKIDLQAPASLLTKRLEQYVQRRVALALGGFHDRVRKVVVRFSYPVPQTGEHRTRCEIEVSLRPLTVRAEDVDADHYLAADKAANRLQRAISRALAHERAWPVSPPTPGLPTVGAGSLTKTPPRTRRTRTPPR